MKILHITASYKPAYIYGGPIMSVAKLCEALAEKRLKNKEQRARNRAQGPGTEKPSTANDNDHFDLEVFTTLANGKTELEIEPNEKRIVDGVAVTYFKRITKDHTHLSPALLFALRKAFRQARTDKTVLVVHIHAWWNLVSIFSCLLAKQYKIPVVLSPRGMLTSYTQGNRNGLIKKIIHQTLGKKLLSYCHIHATSELEKANILNFIQPKSITVIPNLVELENGEQNARDKDLERKDLKSKEKKGKEQRNYEMGSKSQKPTSIDPSGLEPNLIIYSEIDSEQAQKINEQSIFKLLFLSRIEQKKGLALLFDALSKLEIDWQLTVAGSGERDYVDSLKRSAKSLKIDSKITWLGQVKNTDKFNLLAKNDLLVLTSYNENFANVVIESLSVGTAVLLSNQVGLAEYVEQNAFGWITALNGDAVMDAILQAHHNVTKRNFIRENAPKTIAIDFSDDLADRYMELYHNIR